MLKRALLASVLTLAALALPACGNGAEPPGQSSRSTATDLERAQTRWAEVGPRRYTMTLVSSCGERSGLGIFTVTVTPSSAEAEPVKGTRDESVVTTVEDLFAVIEESTDAGAEVVDVIYDTDLGFPRSIEVDYMVDAIDDEACYRVEDFIPTGLID